MKDKYLLPLMLLKFTYVLCFLFAILFLFKDSFNENPPNILLLKVCLELWIFGLIGISVFYLILKLISRYI